MRLEPAIDYFMNAFLGSADTQLRNALLRISTVTEKSKKEILFFEGDPGDKVYYLISGVIKLSRINPEGKEAIIHFVHAGELFAEILFFRKGPYPVTATLLEDAVILGISATGMHDLFRTSPDFSLRLVGLFSQRLKYLVNMVEQLVNSDVRHRFLSYLNQLCETKGNVFTLPVPKGELATLLGTTPETFSRLLHQLDEEGVLTIRGKRITLLQ